ncbi:hypothetical protein AMJ52_03845 [candidate division TA06 bacterium DG_78]|uniref:Uncharacterized protein n=1 Tax=candidate division TA06 bacterium DG_78 TaxID=1703772 RepID=A0A0S7YF34_UNCT6|nr:MAG: hypothetical protein AMJ52_03845 [candidate division TA06 bacterium DG_78]
MIARRSTFQHYERTRLEKSDIWYNVKTDEITQQEVLTSGAVPSKKPSEDVNLDIEITSMIHNIPKPA